MHWFCVCSVTWIPFSVFWWCSVEMENSTRQHVSYKNDNSGFLTFGVISLCFVWNRIRVHSVRNILMVLGRNVEQGQMTSRVQEWQLYQSYFLRYIPLLYLTVIMHWFCVRSVTWIPYGIVWWYLVEMEKRWHVMYKNDNSGFLTFGVILLCFVWNIFHVCSVTQICFGIFWWYLIEMQNRTRWCVTYKNDNSAFHIISVIFLCCIWQWLCIDFVSAL